MTQGILIDACIRDSFSRFTVIGGGFNCHRTEKDISVLTLPTVDREYYMSVLSNHQPEAAVYFEGKFIGLVDVDHDMLESIGACIETIEQSPTDSV